MTNDDTTPTTTAPQWRVEPTAVEVGLLRDEWVIVDDDGYIASVDDREDADSIVADHNAVSRLRIAEEALRYHASWLHSVTCAVHMSIQHPDAWLTCNKPMCKEAARILRDLGEA